MNFVYTTQSVESITESKTATISVETSVISSDKVKMGLTSVEWVEGESSTKLNGMNFFFTFTNQGDSDVIFGNNHPEWKKPVIIAN